jgi:hypothetical protein
MKDFESVHNRDTFGNPAGGAVDGVGVQIVWQDRPLGVGDHRQEPIGASLETVIAICLNRLEFFQTTAFRCNENIVAITGLFTAHQALRRRFERRVVQGIAGTNIPENPPRPQRPNPPIGFVSDGPFLTPSPEKDPLEPLPGYLRVVDEPQEGQTEIPSVGTLPGDPPQYSAPLSIGDVSPVSEEEEREQRLREKDTVELDASEKARETREQTKAREAEKEAWAKAEAEATWKPE